MVTSTFSTSASRAASSLTSSYSFISGMKSTQDGIAYINRGGILDAIGQSLCLLKSPASNRDFDARVS
jgi:hypothetical protein